MECRELTDDERQYRVRWGCCIDCLDLADAARHLNRALKDGDHEAENFWLSSVSQHSNRILRACTELEIRRIDAMREEIQKGGPIEPNSEVKKEKNNKRTRTNLHEKYEINCSFLFRNLVNMGDFNDKDEEKMFLKAKRDWEDLVKVREKLKKNAEAEGAEGKVLSKNDTSTESSNTFDPTGKAGKWPEDDPMTPIFENFKKAMAESPPELQELHWECFKQALREDIERRRKNGLQHYER